jgi:hypothetical protein
MKEECSWNLGSASLRCLIWCYGPLGVMRLNEAEQMWYLLDKGRMGKGLTAEEEPVTAENKVIWETQIHLQFSCS